LRAARDQVQAFDTATQPVNRAIDQLENLLSRPGVFPAQPAAAASADGSASGSLNRDFTAARLKYAALRYEVEARLNQAIANLYELQVRKSNISAERHHARSQKFFFGMLGAQLAVIISTFAIAARQRQPVVEPGGDCRDARGCLRHICLRDDVTDSLRATDY